MNVTLFPQNSRAGSWLWSRTFCGATLLRKFNQFGFVYMCSQRRPGVGCVVVCLLNRLVLPPLSPLVGVWRGAECALTQGFCGALAGLALLGLWHRQCLGCLCHWIIITLHLPHSVRWRVSLKVPVIGAIFGVRDGVKAGSWKPNSPPPPFLPPHLSHYLAQPTWQNAGRAWLTQTPRTAG